MCHYTSGYEFKASSRIAISLIDMNGSLGRVDGSVGFSLENPAFKFLARPIESGIEIEDVNSFLGEETREEIVKKLSNIKKHRRMKGIHININSAIPEHKGFGSKTATLLSIAKAYTYMYGIDMPYEEMAVALGRGGTSGIGVNIIDKGGFILDGGHSRDDKDSFVPSSFSCTTNVPPILANMDMPNWDVLIAIPKCPTIFGESEREFFKSICPIDGHDVEKLSRIVIVQLLPAVVERRLDVFANAINQIQSLRWKQAEIDLHGHIVREIMDAGLRFGAMGAGMSSVGPAIYFLGSDLEKVAESLSKEYDLDLGIDIFMSTMNNTGMQIVERKLS